MDGWGKPAEILTSHSSQRETFDTTQEVTRTCRVFYKEYTHKPSSASKCIFLGLPSVRSLK